MAATDDCFLCRLELLALVKRHEKHAGVLLAFLAPHASASDHREGLSANQELC